MKKIIFILFSVLIFVHTSPAQVRGEYHKAFTEGSFLILENNYKHALPRFLEAYKIDSLNSNINYKVGLCYLKTVSEKAKALPYLEKAIVNTTRRYSDMEPQEKSAPIHAFYYYGQALNLNYKFDEAIASYEKFKSFLVKKQVDLLKDVNRQIEISTNAKILVSAPINVIIKNLGDSINTSYPDYSPLIAADEKTLIFTSRRLGSTGGDKTPEDEFYEDIYISYKKMDGTWGSSVSISPNINTISHEGSIGLSADAQTLFIYKDSNGGDIFYSTTDGNSWETPHAMGSNINSPDWETSACLSPDGNVLYFVSNRKGGLGGRDIWKCKKLPNGKWAAAQNAGAPLNTPFDEESPFIHPGGNILFFSSTGHKSIGGFDIFYSTKNEDGWNAPLNIGYPINTTDDDLYYVTSPDGKRGYYSSSSRPEGYGEKDIYMISMPEQKEQALALIKGTIVPPPGEPVPSNIQIIVTDNESGIMRGIYTPLVRNGSFIIIIPPNSSYTFSYQKDGEEFFSENMEVPADAIYQEINKLVNLKPLLPENPLVATGEKEKSDTIAKVAETNALVKQGTVTVVQPEQLAKVDKLNFQMYFKYNIIQMDVNDLPFKQFVDNLIQLYRTRGSINVDVTSSASQVPSRMYVSNKELASKRSEKARAQLLEALKNGGVEISNVHFSKIKSLVTGPKYNADYLLNKSMYEKYQYIKMTAY